MLADNLDARFARNNNNLLKLLVRTPSSNLKKVLCPCPSDAWNFIGLYPSLSKIRNFFWLLIGPSLASELSS